jgi:hypothetical protein
VPSEQISNPQALYDKATLAALAAKVAPSAAEQTELKNRAKQLLELAGQKGYRDHHRFLRDKAFDIFSDAERQELSQQLSHTASDGAAKPAKSSAHE